MSRNRFPDGVEQRGAALGDRAAAALPGDRPPAALHAQIVRRLPDDDQMLDVLRERQGVALILEQHQRGANTFPGHLPMFDGADPVQPLRVGVRMLKQSQLYFCAQDPAHRIVDPRLGHASRSDQLLQVLDEFHVIIVMPRPVGNHHHVHSRVDGTLDILFVVGRNLIDCRPVRHQKTLEAQLALQHVRQQIFVVRHLPAIPAAVGDHDGFRPRRHRGAVGRQINPAQGVLISDRVALVHAPLGSAVGQIMFRAGQHRKFIGQRRLQSADLCRSQLRDQRRIVAKALIGPAPANVLRHCNAGRKRPVDAGAGDFLGGDPRGLFHQPRIVRGPQSKVVG